MRLDSFLIICTALLVSMTGSLLVVILMNSARPQFAIVDMQALITLQTASLAATSSSDIILTQQGKRAAHHILTTIRAWGRAHNMIIFSKSHCLSSLPEVTADIAHVLQGANHAD